MFAVLVGTSATDIAVSTTITFEDLGTTIAQGDHKFHERCMMKTIIAITLAAAVGILSARTAEAATVTNGFYHTTNFGQDGTFSGANFAVTNIGVAGGTFPIPIPNNSSLVTGFGFNSGTIFDSNVGAIQIGSDSCAPPSTLNPTHCGAALTFMYAPNLLPPGTTTATAPFTMTGQLTVGTTSGDVILNIEGSGTLTATHDDLDARNDSVRFDFSAPEPSSLILVLIGLVAVSWSRWRLGKRAGLSRSTVAAD